MELFPEKLQFGPFILNAANRQLSRDGNEIHLSPKSFDLLYFLLKNPGRILDKDLLLRTVWPDVAVEEGNLTQHISLLRKALGTAPHGDPYIQTHPKAGYALTVPVLSLRTQSSPSVFTRRAVATASLFPLVAVGFYILGRLTAPSSGDYTIRVESFESLPRDPAIRLLCERLQKEITAEISRFPRYRLKLSATPPDSPHTLICSGLLRAGTPLEFVLTIRLKARTAPLWQFSTSFVPGEIDQAAAQARAAIHAYLHARDQNHLSTRE